MTKFLAMILMLSFSGVINTAANSNLRADNVVAFDKKTKGPLTEQQQQAALGFAQEHHPELATLLKRLQSRSAPEFNRGIRELHGAMLRLEKLRERQPKRFESELALWQTESQIRLLTAKWMVSPNDRLKKQIIRLLENRQKVRRRRMKAEKKRINERLKTLEDQLAKTPEELTKAIESEWVQLSKRARRSKSSRLKNARANAPKGDSARKKKKINQSQQDTPLPVGKSPQEQPTTNIPATGLLDE